MFLDMRRLHPRGAANRGISVDADGAMLGPDCVLVCRTSDGFRGIERRQASALQKYIFAADREPDWLFCQTQRIAEALERGELALAQIYGLRIPVGDLDDSRLKLLAFADFTKEYNPDEPRIPKGEPHGGEWTAGGDTSSGEATAAGDDARGGRSSSGNAAPASVLSVTLPKDGAGDDAGSASSSDGPPMRFEWPSSSQPPRASAPPRQDDPQSGPSTLGSPDLGDEGVGEAASTKDTGPPAEGSEPQPNEVPPPEVPADEPATTQQRNAALRAIATWLGRALAILGPAFQLDPRVRMVVAAIETAEWMADYLPKVLSYLDEPKTLEELQNAVGEGGSGYETHHIVEAQKRSKNPQSNAQRFPDQVDAPENLVRVPYWKHVEISSWYSTRNEEFGGITPRKYLRGKSWEEQYKIGIDKLRDFGVLK